MRKQERLRPKGVKFMMNPAVLFASGATDLLAARCQMALTLGFHIVLACFGVGMPVLMLLAEWRWLRTADEGWRTLAQRWSKVFAVLFAVGAVSGTVLSFELGLLWPAFMAKFGSVFGLSFTLEGVAFFLEGIFVGIYLYGWERLSPKAHWLAGLPIAVSGMASAWFVVTVNSWMNAPQGFRLEEGVVVEVYPLQAMLNPATGAQTTHMIVAAYMVTGFMVATVHAVALLRGGPRRHHGRAMALGLALAAPLAPVQLVVGDWAARVVAATQPAKLAAMEGQFRTQRRAPLRIGGLPDAERHVTQYAIEVPGALSWLAYGDVNAEVRGLDAFPSGDQPPTAIVHVAFQVMVLAGTLLLTAAALLGWMRWRRGQWPSSRAALLAISFCGPLAVIALESGWVVTEVGRQPWIVHGLLRTADAVTAAPGVRSVLAVTLAIYAMLLIGTVVALRLLARAPLLEAAHGD